MKSSFFVCVALVFLGCGSGGSGQVPFNVGDRFIRSGSTRPLTEDNVRKRCGAKVSDTLMEVLEIKGAWIKVKHDGPYKVTERGKAGQGYKGFLPTHYWMLPPHTSSSSAPVQYYICPPK